MPQSQTPGQAPGGASGGERWRRIAERLLDAEEPFRILFERVPDLVYLHDCEGVLVFMNRATELFTGYSREEIMGRNLFEIGLLCPADAEFIGGLMARVQERIDVGPFELNIRCKDGSVHTLENRPFPVEFWGETVIVGMARDISERKAVEEARAKSLKEKEILLKEIHHRVKNNLQLVSSLLRLQTDAIKSEPARNALMESQARIRSIALIHESLYRSEDFLHIDFPGYLRRLTSRLVQAYGASHITVETGVDDVSLGIDQAIPCGLLTNELVSNALKHAFPGKRAGRVRVAITRGEQSGSWQLEVADNGVGFDTEAARSAPPTLGLVLARNLAEQIGGRLELHSSPDGTAASVRFGPPAPAPASRAQAGFCL